MNIGDVVIAGGWISPLLEYSEQAKQAAQPMPIDLNWEPRKYRLSYPNTTNAKVFLHLGDRLTILSQPIDPPPNCQHCLFQVRDKDGNQFYLNALYLHEEPAQLSLPFKI